MKQLRTLFFGGTLMCTLVLSCIFPALAILSFLIVSIIMILRKG